MYNHECENPVNQPSIAQTAKQPSVLENEISQLKIELNKINRLTNIITEVIGPSPVYTTPCEEKDNPNNTVANSLRKINLIAEESGDRLESIAKCLVEHLSLIHI